ncbi:MAG: serine hydrolase, partial [Bacillota bacterium]
MTELRDRIRGMIDDLAGDVGLVIKDLKDDTTILHREHERFSAASVIKVPILWELFHQVEARAISLDEVVSVGADVKVGGTGVIKELHDGIQLTIRDLATLMIVVSDNTATNLIID